MRLWRSEAEVAERGIGERDTSEGVEAVFKRSLEASLGGLGDCGHGWGTVACWRSLPRRLGGLCCGGLGAGTLTLALSQRERGSEGEGKGGGFD